ncbi:pentapeptide repeat-containing protein [Propionibacterium australiense]
MYDQEFDGADFSGAKVGYFELRDSVLRSCDFSKTRIEYAVFVGSKRLRRCCLMGVGGSSVMTGCRGCGG